MNNILNKMKEDIWDMPASQAANQSRQQQHSQGTSRDRQIQKQRRVQQEVQKQANPEQQQHQQQRQTQQQQPQRPQLQHKHLGPQHKPQRRRNPPKGQSILRVLQEGHTIPLQQGHAFPMQQTAVNKIKRSIFKLPPPVSSVVDQPQQQQKQQQQQQSPQQQLSKQGIELSNSQQQTQHAGQDVPVLDSVAQKDSGRRDDTTVVSTPSSSSTVPTSTSVSGNTEESKSISISSNNSNEDAANSYKGLQRMVGYFHCEKCKSNWSSTHVYCKVGTKKPEYGQICKTCRREIMPQSVSKPKCHTCGSKLECICDVKSEPFVDPKRAHRRDLCSKCLAGDIFV